MESVEQYLEEVRRVGQVLNVDRHHGKSVLGMIAQVVHDAGLAGPTRRREHYMPGAQRLPQVRQKCRAESQIDRVDGSPRVEFGCVLNFHVVLVVHQICRGNNYTTILMYVNRVLEMCSGRVQRDIAPRRTGHAGRDPARGSRHAGQRFPIPIDSGRGRVDFDDSLGPVLHHFRRAGMSATGSTDIRPSSGYASCPGYTTHRCSSSRSSRATRMERVVPGASASLHSKP